MSKRILNILFSAFLALSALPLLGLSPDISAQNMYRGLVVRLPGEDDFYIDRYNVQPGDVINGEFIIQHEFIEENTPADIYLYAADFEVGEDGATALEPENGRYLDTNYSLARYVVFDKEQVTLQRYGDKETIYFSVEIPDDVDPGLRYARILASGVDPNLTSAEEIADSTGAGIKSRITVATLLISIGDQSNYTTSGEIGNISLRDIEGNRGIFGWLFDLTPLNLVVNVQNTGNQALLLGGNITWHGGDPAEPYDFQKFNEARHRVMPERSRSFFNSWTDGIMYAQRNSEGDIEYIWDLQGDLDPKWGKHFVDVRLSYTDSNDQTQFLVETVEFWLLPWKAILALIIVLLAIFVYIRYKYTNRNKTSKQKKKK